MQGAALGVASLPASVSRGECVGASLASHFAIEHQSIQQNNAEQHVPAQFVAEMQNRPTSGMSAGVKDSAYSGERRGSALLLAAPRRADTRQTCQTQAEQGDRARFRQG